jgi:hypothetical protein
MKRVIAIAFLALACSSAFAGPASPEPLPPPDGGPSIHEMLTEAIQWWLSIC